MGSLNFNCPPPEALSDIDKVTCPEKTGQIQRLAFRLVQDPAAASPTFTTVTDLADKTKWTAALAATDRKKIVITPFISGIVIPPGAPITEEGNNNNTVNGMTMLNGFQSVMVTGRILNLPTAIAEQLRELTQFSALTPGFTDLEAFFVNEFGDIVHDMELDNVIPKGFPIYNWVVPPVGSEGLNKPDVTNVQFELTSQWDARRTFTRPTKKVTGAWNPLSL